jgi:hypothetical protein
MNTIRIRTALLGLFLFATSNALAGYDLHITRAKDWTESKKTPITLMEWTEFIKTDKEFRLVEAAVRSYPFSYVSQDRGFTVEFLCRFWFCSGKGI